MVECHIVQAAAVHRLQADLAGARGVHDLGDDLTVRARRHEDPLDVAATPQRFQHRVPAVQHLANRPLPTRPEILWLIAIVEPTRRRTARAEGPAAGLIAARPAKRRASGARPELTRPAETGATRRRTTRPGAELTRATWATLPAGTIETGTTLGRATWTTLGRTTWAWPELTRTARRRTARPGAELTWTTRATRTTEAGATRARRRRPEVARHAALHEWAHRAGVLRAVDAAGARSSWLLLPLVVAVVITRPEAAAPVAASWRATRSERPVIVPERPVSLGAWATWATRTARTTKTSKRPATRRPTLAAGIATVARASLTLAALILLGSVVVAVTRRPGWAAGWLAH